MSGTSDWERQEKEIESYNTFFSALSPRQDDTLASHGFELPVTFPPIGKARGRTVHPDFILYDGDCCILVEVKQGSNFNDDHVEQMAACSQLTISTLEDYLKDSEVRDKTSYNGYVSNIETCIIYQGIDEKYIENCRTEWGDCRESLEKLTEVTPVLAQGKGEPVRTVAGSFDSERIDSIFSSGVPTSQNPSKEFYLTETTEKESLAVAISLHWGQQAVKGPIELTATDIRNHFAPRHALGVQKVRRVLQYLVEVDACNELPDEDDNDYEFTVENIDQVLSIAEIVRENPVEDTLQDDQQSTVYDW